MSGMEGPTKNESKDIYRVLSSSNGFRPASRLVPKTFQGMVTEVVSGILWGKIQLDNFKG